MLVRYLESRGVVRPITGDVGGSAPPCVVVIPARAESAFLPACLESVARSARSAGMRPLVVVVVNNPAPAAAPDPDQARVREDARDNARLLAWLRKARFDELRLAWIDCASPGRELPPKRGVGLARKIGCDSAVHLLIREADRAGASRIGEVVMLNLDADTEVAVDWLGSVAGTLREAGTPGGLCRFRHALPDAARHRQATCAYELYMRYYLESLRRIGSPYAFTAMGSILACTVAGYCRAGGFPASRRAGEDFYFAQQLAKTGGLLQFLPGLVRPSARLSHRVPFGTGPAVQRILTSGVEQYRVFSPEAFRALGTVLERAEAAAESGAPAEAIVASFPEFARAFLAGRGLARVWERFLKQFRDPAARRTAFHEWFDGLATLQFLRFLTETRFPPVPVLDGVRCLPDTAHLAGRRGWNVETALAALRVQQHRRREVVGPRAVNRQGRSERAGQAPGGRPHA